MFEAMACEIPVVIYLNYWNVKCFGEMPPIANAKTVDEVFEAMIHLADKKTRRRIGEKERKFVLKYNHPDIVVNKFIKLYEEVLS
jgi:glycosyltransferase involved in cell wall biosynthesis